MPASETIAEKPVFKSVFKKQRIIIPMDGFYEWQQGSEGAALTKAGKPSKQPMFIHRLDGEPLAVAGLWTTWRDKTAGPDAPWLHSCTDRHDVGQRDDGAGARPDAGDAAGRRHGRNGSIPATTTSRSCNVCWYLRPTTC